jgi:eukaryotic-like serine/threonine-protein kinase
LIPNAPSVVADQTATQHRYFSPQYAAPEQLLGAPIGVGCDVYALGQLLFELLAGARAFDFADLSAGQIERLITSVPPPSPSQVASTKGASSLLQRELRGDLDGIVLRCLRKAASERYASVEQFDSDLRNYLHGLPVQARGGHLWYRARKFLWRNLLAVALTSIVAMALVVGAVAFAWQAAIAERRAAELQQVTEFQADMLKQIEPSLGGAVLLRSFAAKHNESLARSGLAGAEQRLEAEMFGRALARVDVTDIARNFMDEILLQPSAVAIDLRFAEQPLLAVKLKQVLADRYLGMGLDESGLSLQEATVDARKRLLGGDHQETLESQSKLGLLLENLDRLDEAEELLLRTLAVQRDKLGSEHVDSLDSMFNLAQVYLAQGRNSDAEPLFREALTARRRVLGNEDPATLQSITGLGVALWDLGRMDETETLIREVWETQPRVLGSLHPRTLSSNHNYGALLQAIGRLTEAESVMREVVLQRRQVLGENHPDTLV